MRIEIDKEEYKDLIETKEEFVKTVKKLKNIIIENIKLTDNLQAKEQECEELKEQLNQAKYLSEGALRLYSERQNIKYKQVLDEIEEYFKSKDKRNTSLFNIFVIEQEILDIINKAKKGN